MKTCFSILRVVRSVRCCSGRAHADGVLCSANVPRPSASSFISLRRAHHRRDRSEHLLIGRKPAACPRAQGTGCPPQRNKGGAEGGGHSRRGTPGVLCTRPEQERPRTQATRNTTPRTTEMTPKTLEVNARSYRWMSRPTVVVCVDGCEPAYLDAAVAAGVAPYLDRMMKSGANLRAD